MKQSDRGTYQKDSVMQQFYRSCLGKVIILAVVSSLLLLIARLTVPGKEYMLGETTDNIRQCIEANINIPADKIDNVVNNMVATFTHADSLEAEESMKDFWKYNTIEVYEHFFFTTSYVHNNYLPGGKRAGIGVFGLVISTVDYSDLLLRVAPVRKEYNQRIITNTWSNEVDLGSNPDLGNTYNTYDGDGSSN